MFSLPVSWPSHGTLRRVFSLDSWLLHLRLWHNSEHSSQSTEAPVPKFRSAVKTAFPHNPPRVAERLILRSSPSMHWGFDDEESESESESDTKDYCAESLRCLSPTNEHDHHLVPVSKSSPNGPIITNGLNHAATTTPAHAGLDMKSLLAQYSDQELVLLEFLTHSSSFEGPGIDNVLDLYPPGFANECHCDPEDDEGEKLCQVCLLMEAYLDHSFERYNGLAAVSL